MSKFCTTCKTGNRLVNIGPCAHSVCESCEQPAVLETGACPRCSNPVFWLEIKVPHRDIYRVQVLEWQVVTHNIPGFMAAVVNQDVAPNETYQQCALTVLHTCLLKGFRAQVDVKCLRWLQSTLMRYVKCKVTTKACFLCLSELVAKAKDAHTAAMFEMAPSIMFALGVNLNQHDVVLSAMNLFCNLARTPVEDMPLGGFSTLETFVPVLVTIINTYLGDVDTVNQAVTVLADIAWYENVRVPASEFLQPCKVVWAHCGDNPQTVHLCAELVRNLMWHLGRREFTSKDTLQATSLLSAFLKTNKKCPGIVKTCAECFRYCSIRMENKSELLAAKSGLLWTIKDRSTDSKTVIDCIVFFKNLAADESICGPVSESVGSVIPLLRHVIDDHKDEARVIDECFRFLEVVVDSESFVEFDAAIVAELQVALERHGERLEIVKWCLRLACTLLDREVNQRLFIDAVPLVLRVVKHYSDDSDIAEWGSRFFRGVFNHITNRDAANEVAAVLLDVVTCHRDHPHTETLRVANLSFLETRVSLLRISDVLEMPDQKRTKL